MQKIELNSYAKLNLFLNILDKREDGYHNLETIFERISLCDKIVIQKIDSGIALSCTDKSIENSDNLAYKAAELFFEHTGTDAGVDISIVKNIPKGGGLGGASSNAAYVLMGMNQLFETALSKAELYLLGAQLGSDVNFFISEERFALGLGRGEEITAIKSDKKLDHILLLGHEEISTVMIFRLFNSQLTKYTDSARLLIQFLEQGDGEFPIELLYNALSEPYLQVSKKAGKIFEELNRADATFLLSGSGATINVMVPNAEYKLDEAVQTRLREWGIRFLKVTSQ